MKKLFCKYDEMTPVERQYAIDNEKDYDRLMCMPFMGEIKRRLTGISSREFWKDPRMMLNTEIEVFNRFGMDRIVIGPNSTGIVESLTGSVIYPKHGSPEIICSDEETIYRLVSNDSVHRSDDVLPFRELAMRLIDEAVDIVPVEMSIGGPFTIAAFIYGTEKLLRDVRRKPDDVKSLLNVIVREQIRCIDVAAECGTGIAVADPVAGPDLIGPKLYSEFVEPYTRDLVEYALKKTGRGASLHMCGNTRKIWTILKTYKLHEISLDQCIDMSDAAREIGDKIAIAGNIDPVDVMLYGSESDIQRAVRNCILEGSHAKAGYTVATGCDLPYQTPLKNIGAMMDAVRSFGKMKWIPDGKHS